MSAVSLLISMNLPTALGIQAAEQNLSLTLVEKNEPVHWYFQRILVFLKIPGVNKPSVESKTCGNYTKKIFPNTPLYNTLQVALMIEAELLLPRILERYEPNTEISSYLLSPYLI